jgi:uncharacterized protein YdhG (YjbR/CyaY superfamily)
MQPKATTVAQYLAQLPPERRAALTAVRKVIRANLDRGFAERMHYGMIGYCVPHRLFPAGYHCDPEQSLPFAGLAAQKGHMALYLMHVYGDEREAAWLRAAFAKSGKKLDMGKSCIRFRRLEDLPLAVIGESIRRVRLAEYVARYERSLGGRAARKGPTPPRKVRGRRGPRKARAHTRQGT